MSVPILLYGSEFCTLNKQERRFEAAKMKFIRSVTNCKRNDHVGNERAREELNIFGLPSEMVYL